MMINQITFVQFHQILLKIIITLDQFKNKEILEPHIIKISFKISDTILNKLQIYNLKELL